MSADESDSMFGITVMKYSYTKLFRRFKSSCQEITTKSLAVTVQPFIVMVVGVEFQI